MRSVSYRLLALAACVAVAGAPRIAAAEIDDDSATKLEQSLNGWLAGLLGPAVDLGERPVHVAASDDHFALEIPIGRSFGDLGAGIDAGPVTASVRPIDGARWAIDKLAMPSPLVFTAPAPQGGGTVETTVTIESQDQRGVLDPTLATVSTFDSTTIGYQSSVRQPNSTDKTRLERMVSHLTLRPAGPGRVDVHGESDATLMSANATALGVGNVSISAAKLSVKARIDRLAPAMAAPIIHAVAELGAMAMKEVREEAARSKQMQAADGSAAPKRAPKANLDKNGRAALRAAVVAMQSLCSGFDEQYSLEDMRVKSAEFSGHVGKFSSGMAMSAPDGMLRMRLNFVLDGIDSPNVPEGVYREYLPRHIALTPRLGGVASDKVMALLLKAIDSDGNDPGLNRQAQALIEGGAVVAGIDDLAVDFGPSSVRGNGEVHVLGPDHYTAVAHVTATGLDTLIRRANTTPELQQAAPVLIFLKGIGLQDGDRVVWDVSYAGKTLLVNGTDMSQMMPPK